MNYFLGDGERTDRIHNQVHDITKDINSNTQNVYQNQELLKLKSMSNKQTFAQLEMKTAYSGAIELAKIHNMGKLMMKLSSQVNNGILFEIIINEIKETEMELSNFVLLLGKMCSG